MSCTEEFSLTVPADLVKRTNGLAIDIGGSVAKFIYRSQENLKEAETNTAHQTGHLQLVSFTKIRLSDALEFIKERALMTEDCNKISEQSKIFATGFGCTEFEKAIFSTLNIRIQNVNEFECSVKAFTHLASKLSREDFLEARDKIAAKEAEDEIKEELAILSKLREQYALNGFEDLNSDRCDDQSPPDNSSESNKQAISLDECEVIYPCLVIVIGSASVYLQVDEDKSFKVLDICERGGATFHGIGTLLTGCKEYEELMELTVRGNERNVSICSNDLQLSETTDRSDNNLYASCSLYKEPKVIYSFGKAAGSAREDFRPEDLATAWLKEFIRELSQSLFLLCEATQIRRMFLCGGFCNHPLVRRILTMELVKKIVFMNATEYKKGEQVQFDFVKAGHHLGALGALVIQLEQSMQESGNEE